MDNRSSSRTSRQPMTELLIFMLSERAMRPRRQPCIDQKTTVLIVVAILLFGVLALAGIANQH